MLGAGSRSKRKYNSFGHSNKIVADHDADLQRIQGALNDARQHLEHEDAKLAEQSVKIDVAMGVMKTFGEQKDALAKEYSEAKSDRRESGEELKSFSVRRCG